MVAAGAVLVFVKELFAVAAVVQKHQLAVEMAKAADKLNQMEAFADSMAADKPYLTANVMILNENLIPKDY